MNTARATSGLGFGIIGLFLQAGGYFVQRTYGEWHLLGAVLYVVGQGCWSQDWPASRRPKDAAPRGPWPPFSRSSGSSCSSL